MMVLSTSANILRALVQTYRADTSLKASLTGGLHEGFAPEKAPYPVGVYVPVAMPYEDAWGSRLILAVVDITVFSRDPVEASNLDQSFAQTFDGASLTVEGQTALICRRVRDLRRSPELDEEGTKIHGSGGTYEVWTDQPL